MAFSSGVPRKIAGKKICFCDFLNVCFLDESTHLVFLCAIENSVMLTV